MVRGQTSVSFNISSCQHDDEASFAICKTMINCLGDIKMILILSLTFVVICSRAFQASESYSNETIKVEDASKEARFASVCVSETCLLQADTVLSHMDDKVRH